MAITTANASKPIHLQGYALTNLGSHEYVVTRSEPALGVQSLPPFFDPGVHGYFADGPMLPPPAPAPEAAPPRTKAK